MFEDASLNGMVPLTPNNESSNITRPSLPVPNIGAALTDQQDKVKNLLELTRPLTELTPASTWWRRRSMRAHTTLVGSPKYSDIYLRREKDKRDQISREAWQLASNTYKAEKLAFLRKEIKTTKNAMDKALTTARSFSTRERQQLSKGLSTAIEAEALKDKEVLKVEDNLPLRENGYQYRPHPYTRSGWRGSNRRGRGRGYDTHRYRWDTPQKNHFFQDPAFNGGGHTFSKGWTSSCRKSCLKPKTNTWQHPTNEPIMKRLEDKKGQDHTLN